MKVSNGYDYRNNFVSKISLDKANLQRLVENVIAPNFFEEFFKAFPNISDYLSNITYFPLETCDVTDEAKLIFIGSYNSTNCKGRITYSPTLYYNMGSYPILYRADFSNYLNYDGFSNLEIYLPFVGYVNISINKLMSILLNMDSTTLYLVFRLYVDYATGAGKYFIYASDHIPKQDSLMIVNDLNENFTFINSFDCMIGVNIPIGSTNANDMYRNVVMGGLKAVGGLATTVDLMNTPESKFSSSNTRTVTESKVVKGRSKAAARAGERSKILERTTKERTETTETDGGYRKSQAVRGSMSDTLSTSISSLNSLYSNAHSNSNGNANLFVKCDKHIIIRKYKPRVNDMIVPSRFANAKIFGLPYGKFDTLNSVHGLTFITDIHLEDMGDTVTADELELIEENLKNGVILP